MSKYNYVDLNSSKMLTTVNSLNIGIESDELFINNELNFNKNININSINNKGILLPRKPEIYDANKLVLTNSTYNDFEYLQFNNRIIQTQFTQYRTDFTSSGTGWKPLPFSVTITPKNIHSQILISTAVYYSGSNTSADFGFRLYKKVGSGSFAPIPLAQNLDYDTKGSGVFMSNNSGVDSDNYYQYQTACVTNEFLDYPHTTDIIEYKLYCSPDLSDSANTDVFYINRPANSNDNYRAHSSSYIKAQEIEIYKYTDYEAPIVTEYFMNNQLYKIFTFLKDGKLVLPKDTICDYLIVAGGGGGGSSTNASSIEGGGGGAGGLIYRESISLTTGTYNIKVGDGGDAETNGEDSYIESELVPLVGYGVADNNLNAYTSSFDSNETNTYDNNIYHNNSTSNVSEFIVSQPFTQDEFIKYDFGSTTPVRVIHYKIFSLYGFETAMPSSWTFEASNDDLNWDILDTQTGITNWDDEKIMNNYNINNDSTNYKASSNPTCAKSYNVSNINKYRYYKIVFTANGGNSSLFINELALFGGSDSLFEGARGGGGSATTGNGNSGGSGSGGRHPDGSIGGNAISYNNGSVSTNQGYIQGINQVGVFGNQGGTENSSANTGGGGGGAGAPGNNGGDLSNFGHGGIGKRYNIRDGETAVYYAGGGAAGKTSLVGIRSGGGLGGGGDGASYSYDPLTYANYGGNGKPNTGGGGGGSHSLSTDAYSGGKGGSGIVIVRVPQNLNNSLNIPKATGGIISYYTLDNVNYCVHTFIDSGIFIPESSLQVNYLIVAGGGSGGSGGQTAAEGAGGGAGGLIYQENITFSNNTYIITIGKGGSENTNGENSSIIGSGLSVNNIALGGGRGGHGDYPYQDSNNKQNTGANGGSGGGGCHSQGSGGSAIVTSGDSLTENSTTPNEVGVFGNKGGADLNVTINTGGGGGGAGGRGYNGSLGIGENNLSGSGFGGVGKQYSIRTGSLEYYAGGGGASSNNHINAIGASGGLGGGGKGGGGSLTTITYNSSIKYLQARDNNIGEDGKPNTGGGGGGTFSAVSVKGGDGGSGIVVIRYQL